MRRALVIFDFDGTLADSGPWMVRALNEAAPRFGYRTASDAEIEVFRGMDNRAIMRAIGLPLWKLPFIAHHIRSEAEKAPPPLLFDGVPDALARLRDAGVRLAIVSSNSERLIRRALGAQAELIELYACNAGLFGKAQKFRRVLWLARLAPKDAIAVGDEARDIEAARQAGIACAGVEWGYALPSLLAARGPDMMFASVADMAARLSAP